MYYIVSLNPKMTYSKGYHLNVAEHIKNNLQKEYPTLKWVVLGEDDYKKWINDK